MLSELLSQWIALACLRYEQRGIEPRVLNPSVHQEAARISRLFLIIGVPSLNLLYEFGEQFQSLWPITQ